MEPYLILMTRQGWGKGRNKSPKKSKRHVCLCVCMCVHVSVCDRVRVCNFVSGDLRLVACSIKTLLVAKGQWLLLPGAQHRQ